MTNDPVLIAYAVKRSASGKHPTWTRIGSAYPHETGAGLTVVLDAIPPDGRVILLERDQADDERLGTSARTATGFGGVAAQYLTFRKKCRLETTLTTYRLLQDRKVAIFISV